MEIKRDLITCCIALLGFLVFSSCQSVGRLPSFNVFDKKLCLSGFSSGGTFAQMYQFVFSSQIQGVAVFSHTFYRCGRPVGLVDVYDQNCTKLFNATETQIYNPDLVHEDIKDYYSKGLIENPENIRNKRLYVYTGLGNFLFYPEQSLNVLRVYERYIRNHKRIMTRVQDANSVMPTNNPTGNVCTANPLNTTFIGNCGFSGAYEALKFLHAADHNMKTEPPAAAGKYKEYLQSRLKTFDQREFYQGLQNHFMDTQGFYFVPKKCERQKCLIHFFFHGCFTGREFMGPVFIENSGYLELGDKIGIVMVFPQVLSSSPENVIGCWDTLGLAGPLYATNVGPQINAVKRMIERSTGKFPLEDNLN